MSVPLLHRRPACQAAYCLRAIAFQLATTYSIFSEELIELYKRTKFSATRQNFQAIWDTIFEGIVFKVDFGRTLHWVFDGLDEADTPYIFLRKLVLMKPKSQIKILLSVNGRGSSISPPGRTSTQSALSLLQ